MSAKSDKIEIVQRINAAVKSAGLRTFRLSYSTRQTYYAESVL